MMNPHLPVLLAEDDEHDVFFMRRAFEKARIENPLFVVPNGQEAIWYLKGESAYADRGSYPEPGLLLLDLKMPLLNGFEVLAWIQGEPHWKDNLAVIVLSSSAIPEDKRRAFDLGAQEYLVKPPSFKDLARLMGDVKRRWLTQAGPGVKSPPAARPDHTQG